MSKAELSDYRVVESGGFRSHPRWPWLHVGADGAVWDDSLKRYRKQTTNNDGYKTVWIEGSDRYVHRLVIESWHGLDTYGDGDVTRHRAGNPAWNCVWQLTVGTQRENHADRVRHHNNGLGGLCSRGHIKAGANLSPAHLKRCQHVCLSCQRANGKANGHEKRTGIEVPASERKAWADNNYHTMVAESVGHFADCRNVPGQSHLFMAETLAVV